MLENALLSRAVVVGRNHQSAVGTGFLRLACETDRLVRGVRSCACNDWHSLMNGLDHSFDNVVVLLMTQRCRFALRAARYNAVCAVADMKFYQRFETFPV